MAHREKNGHGSMSQKHPRPWNHWVTELSAQGQKAFSCLGEFSEVMGQIYTSWMQHVTYGPGVAAEASLKVDTAMRVSTSH